MEFLYPASAGARLDLVVTFDKPVAVAVVGGRQLEFDVVCGRPVPEDVARPVDVAVSSDGPWKAKQGKHILLQCLDNVQATKNETVIGLRPAPDGFYYMNSGIMLFRKHSPFQGLLKDWKLLHDAASAQSGGEKSMGDQELLPGSRVGICIRPK
jgi:hypothetical protein